MEKIVLISAILFKSYSNVFYVRHSNSVAGQRIKIIVPV